MWVWLNECWHQNFVFQFTETTQDLQTSGMTLHMPTTGPDRCCPPTGQQHIWNSRKVSMNTFRLWPFGWTVCRWMTDVLRATEWEADHRLHRRAFKSGHQSASVTNTNVRVTHRCESEVWPSVSLLTTGLNVLNCRYSGDWCWMERIYSPCTGINSSTEFFYCFQESVCFLKPKILHQLVS